MRRLYIVTYDISNPKRLRRIFKTMKGFGQHIQLSVFRCDLTGVERMELERSLSAIIHHAEDQVIIVDLGTITGRSHAVCALGRPLIEESRGAQII